MELYLKITYLNDFIFCPLSIYYHQLYGGLSERLYYDNCQLNGKAAHAAIDEHRYSTHKNILQGTDVFCNEYKLCGKIDIFDIENGILTERKKHIVRIYDGYIFQLYAQCLCLREMGYAVRTIRFYSSDDNKVYPVLLPEDDNVMFEKFKLTLRKMQTFDVGNFQPENKLKCKNCIYSDFCDRTLAV
ncbi:MAG: type V CRISPR-associated protein Cas4 [Spirochaetia bacterium]|nr:type V CRISPR-associated protein Cas4 [Spirochaetia bacterium]